MLSSNSSVDSLSGHNTASTWRRFRISRRHTLICCTLFSKGNDQTVALGRSEPSMNTAANADAQLAAGVAGMRIGGGDSGGEGNHPPLPRSLSSAMNLPPQPPGPPPAGEVAARAGGESSDDTRYEYARDWSDRSRVERWANRRGGIWCTQRLRHVFEHRHLGRRQRRSEAARRGDSGQGSLFGEQSVGG